LANIIVEIFEINVIIEEYFWRNRIIEINVIIEDYYGLK
jgi:hypothetical protein